MFSAGRVPRDRVETNQTASIHCFDCCISLAVSILLVPAWKPASKLGAMKAGWMWEREAPSRSRPAPDHCDIKTYNGS